MRGLVNFSRVSYVFLLFSFLLFQSSFAISRDLTNLTFSELSQEKIIPLFSKINQKVYALSLNTDPDETKKLRKEIGVLKLYLDLFVWVYPKYFGMDPLKVVRSLYDKGYGVVGDFKDLHDLTQIPQYWNKSDDFKEKARLEIEKFLSSEVPSRKLRLLRWRELLGKKVLENDSLNYLSHPLEDSFQARENEDLPRYFWRNVNFTPDQRLSGLENIRLLAKEKMKNVSGDIYQNFSRIGNVLATNNEETLHHFRKSLRFILRLQDLFPGLVSEEKNSSLIVKDLTKLVSDLGFLHDQIILANMMDDMIFEKLEDFPKGFSVTLEEMILSQWKELKESLEENHIQDKLDEYATYFE